MLDQDIRLTLKCFCVFTAVESCLKQSSVMRNPSKIPDAGTSIAINHCLKAGNPVQGLALVALCVR